jgi:hypothetical protein
VALVSAARRHRRALPGLLLFTLAAACEHPIAVVTPHAEVADLVLTDAVTRQEVARTTDNRTWSGAPLELCVDRTRTLLPVPLDFRGAPVDLVSRRDLEVRAEAADPLVAWEPLRGRGQLHPLAPGRTRLRFLVWHLTHADLVTPWLEVLVLARDACPPVPSAPSPGAAP